MKIMRLNGFWMFLVLMASFGCVKNNKDYAYIEVSSWDLIANPNSVYNVGELTHNFSDAYLYVDDDLIGIFEVPFKVPVLKEGSVNVKLYPAIRNNGISATKKLYPFVKFYEENIVLTHGGTAQINPKTSYQSPTKFWIEDFEDASIKITNDPNSNALMTAGNDPAILQWGNFYGDVQLTTLNNLWVGVTNSSLNLPKGSEVYLELNYRNSNSLITGLLASSSTGGVAEYINIQVNAQDPNQLAWKKIYIDLKELVSNSGPANVFEQFFKAELNAGKTDASVQLDNIKVVYF